MGFENGPAPVLCQGETQRASAATITPVACEIQSWACPSGNCLPARFAEPNTLVRGLKAPFMVPNSGCVDRRRAIKQSPD